MHLSSNRKGSLRSVCVSAENDRSSDLWVCEQIQRGLESGSDAPLLFGALETPIAWFHATLDERSVHVK